MEAQVVPENWMKLIQRWAVYDRIRLLCACLLFLPALIAPGLTGLR